MPTARQIKLASNIIANSKRKKPLNKKELVVSSGYAEISAESSAHLIIEQKGVQEVLEDYGFTEDNAKKVVAKILLNDEADDGHRLKAAEQVFKVRGSYSPEKSINLNITQKPNEKIKKLTDELRRIQRRGDNPSN